MSFCHWSFSHTFCHCNTKNIFCTRPLATPLDCTGQRKHQDGGKENGGSPCNLKMKSFAAIVLQNSHNFCECERRTVLEWKVWSVRLACFTLEDHAYSGCFRSIAKRFLIPLGNTKRELGNAWCGGEHLLSNWKLNRRKLNCERSVAHALYFVFNENI